MEINDSTTPVKQCKIWGYVMSIKLSGVLPLAAYAVQSKVTASLQVKSNTSASSNSASATKAKGTSVASAVATAAKTSSSSQSPVSIVQPKGSVGTIYTSGKQIVTNTQTIGSKFDISVTATTPTSGSTGSSGATTAPNTSSSISTTQTLTPNEQILLAKQLYDNAHKLGNQAGMTELAESMVAARTVGLRVVMGLRGRVISNRIC